MLKRRKYVGKLLRGDENMSKKVILTFDDCCISHLTFVAPLLQKYGFGATFFVSMPDEWYRPNPGKFLSPQQILQLYHLGFEIGNHTLNHAGMQPLNDEQCRNEIAGLNNILAGQGIPLPVSFAYPGGPYAENAARILPEFGIRFARTTEKARWNRRTTDPLRIPCFAVCSKEPDNFAQALELSSEDADSAVVILYHGVPDEVHPHCDTSPELFEKHMKYLSDNGFQVLSMSGFGLSC